MNTRFRQISSTLLALVMALTCLLGVSAANPIPDFIDLNIPQSFRITRPTSEITTTYSTYFITGTSDPGTALYFENEEVERIGTMGTFGVLVDLEPGLNTFTFRQGGQTETVNINRGGGGANTISVITQASMYPNEVSYVRPGGTITLSCVAPAGASVTATIGGKNISLKQSVPGASEGIPATFTGKLTAPSSLFEDGRTNDAGSVAYILSYKGNTTKYESSASLYAVGSGAVPVLEVKNSIGVVYKDAKTSSNFRVQLKKGTVDYAVGQESGRFKLSSGGYIPKSNVNILTGSPNITNEISKVSVTNRDRYESYIIQGTAKSAFYPVLGGETFTLTLYNAENAPKIDISNSRLFSKAVSQEQAENTVKIQYTLKEGADIWGYNLNYNKNGNIVLTFLYKPVLTNSDKPFENLVIMLDPGHGGEDPGALGVAGTTGPNEADLNLAHAYVVKDHLESLGATVYLTRDEDDYLALDKRLDMIEKYRPDFFLSIHHNSIAESSNANNARGTEIYYHTKLSKSFSSQALSSLISKIGRQNRGDFESYYRVTLLPYCPALLLELGFMSHPREYEESTTLDTMEKVAAGIEDAIRKSLR